MKKLIVPIFLFIAVYTVSLFAQSFTILRQESLGLFLNTPDFYKEVFSSPLPVSNLIGSFLVQFYSDNYIGALIVTILVLLCQLFLFQTIKGRLPAPMLVSTFVACIAWNCLARAHHPSIGVSFVLFIFVAFLVSFFLNKNRGKDKLKWTELIICFVFILFSTAALLLSRHVRDMEKISKIEYAASDYNWDFILKIATPEETSNNMAMVPYALLALNAKGELADNISKYHVSNEFGLDFGNEKSYRAYHFKSVLYSSLGCPNEAVHNLFQSGMLLPHGSSFRTLRMLVQFNYALCDSMMVVKYCDVLDKSLNNRKFVEFFRNYPCPQKDYSSTYESSVSPMIRNHDQMENMLYLSQDPINSKMARERYMCYFNILH